MSTCISGQLVITLKSDLCVGSGYSYAGIVDSDSCYDELGIPYIPGKRIKGCIRESAESYLCDVYTDNEIETLFGKKGRNQGTDLFIDNAYIKNYDLLRGILFNNNICSSQEILDKYTRVTGQTRIYEGVADIGSLRFTRSVNHYDPMDNKKELVFFADFSCNSESLELLKKAVKATRHIGLKRNRGLGNVQIEVVLSDLTNKRQDTYIKFFKTSDGKVIISYAVKNTQPLMLSRNMEDESEDYIAGQQVIGVLAGRYLKKSGRSAEDTEFIDLFLNGQTVFSNLYPYDGKDIYYPAADYLNRLKKSKRIVFNLEADLPSESEINDTDNYWYGNGNQPKKLKGKFLTWKGVDTVAVYEIKKDVVYHHSHRNTHDTINGKEGILYGLEVIRKGQMFAGSIIVQEKYSELVKELLLEGDFSFGKSKTAQYGKCRLIKFEERNELEKKFEKDRDIVVTFLSDAIIKNENGTPVVFYDDVRSSVAEALGIEDICNEKYISSIQVTMATGYMGTWNLRRPSIPAIRAGSFLTYHLTNNLSGGSNYVGERTLEGYGHIRIDYADRCRFDGIKEDDLILDDLSGSFLPSCEKFKGLIIPILYDRWLNKKINNVISEPSIVNVGNASIGRFTLMLRESITEAGIGNETDALKKFEERIRSIKSDSTQKEGKKLLELIKKRLLSTEDSAANELANELKRMGFEINEKEMLKRWPQFLMGVLTDRKYKGR